MYILKRKTKNTTPPEQFVQTLIGKMVERREISIPLTYIYMTAHPACFVKHMPTKRGGVKLALMGQMSGKCLPHVSKM